MPGAVEKYKAMTSREHLIALQDKARTLLKVQTPFTVMGTTIYVAIPQQDLADIKLRVTILLHRAKELEDYMAKVDPHSVVGDTMRALAESLQF